MGADSFALTPVDALVARRLGLNIPFSRSELEGAQLNLLRQVLAWAKGHSPFYQHHLRNCLPKGITSFADFTKVPFIDGRDLREHGAGMLCVSQSAIERVVTLTTSGSTGPAKRVWFTRDDLDSTLDFFAKGMLTMVEPGQRVAALLPDDTPEGVGALLKTALKEIWVECRCIWPPSPDHLGVDIAEGRFDCVAGLPAHILALAESFPGRDRVKTVLLCSEYIARSLRSRIETAWGCTTFMHYGSTETGLGGGVECAAHCGCHMREADLLLEIIDPESGEILGDGECGEIVITTLVRKGMPLIRYRTGDMGSLERGLCACGGKTIRLSNLHGRLNTPLLATGERLWLADLDEAMYGLLGLGSYSAELRPGNPESLYITVQGDFSEILDPQILQTRLEQAVLTIPGLASAVESGGLVLDFYLEGADPQVPHGFSHTGKRAVRDMREDSNQEEK
ncbi:MAG: DVU_1553 family AMP-dependent CoA ligase [Desulfovibrio sp.]|uniref:DVU_1553 family AMP-dependent CoA ligase n=1 Tax=Desulfovibrio sp. 7SRBS1 TaxID=3378064 RepID=UPI003B406A66